MKRNLASLLGGALIFLGIMIPIGTIPVVFALPPEYRSQTRLMIPPSPKVLLESEAEIIQSRRILSVVVTNLNLPRRFAEQHKMEQDMPPEVALALLQRQVNVKVHPTTRILETSVYSRDRSEAADIANEIANVYLASAAADAIDPGNPARLLDAASPAFRPSRPNRPLAMASSMAVGLSLVLGGAWLIYASWKNRNRSSKPVPPALPAV
ncbi:MAG: hypothetical protein JNN07_09740 [Verrucomicrobiales bacterium]|nr:hypothetical protein [Verrucomicrobiales bacterium]